MEALENENLTLVEKIKFKIEGFKTDLAKDNTVEPFNVDDEEVLI